MKQAILLMGGPPGILPHFYVGANILLNNITMCFVDDGVITAAPKTMGIIF
jgi:hypothetical protein